jgi:YVTN family beta-propeller protein
LLLFCFQVASSAASAQNVRPYVDNREGDDVSVIARETLDAVDDIHLADKVHGLVLSPDGTELGLTGLLEDSLCVYDLKADTITGRVPLGDGPNWVTFSPDGKHVCVTDAGTDGVSIIDVRARRELKRVEVGRRRSGWSWPCSDPSQWGSPPSTATMPASTVVAATELFKHGNDAH